MADVSGEAYEKLLKDYDLGTPNPALEQKNKEATMSQDLLDKYNVHKEDLPIVSDHGSVPQVFVPKPSFYETYRFEIWMGSIFAILFLLTLVIAISLRRPKRVGRSSRLSS